MRGRDALPAGRVDVGDQDAAAFGGEALGDGGAEAGCAAWFWEGQFGGGSGGVERGGGGEGGMRERDGRTGDDGDFAFEAVRWW